MLSKRIIPCLDVREGKVVKGVRFCDHRYAGEIESLAAWYRDEGADELVFYDITASTENRRVSQEWIRKVAKKLDIPFCVAGGIKSTEDARKVFDSGADKVSINSPALLNPDLINLLSEEFGSQSIVVGIDSDWRKDAWQTWMLTGDPKKSAVSGKKTLDWIIEVQKRGAGEIVLNCMNADGMRTGYDIRQIAQMRGVCQVPLIASGGAGSPEHFEEVFSAAGADGALAAGVFHTRKLKISQVKNYLKSCQPEISVRGPV